MRKPIQGSFAKHPKKVEFCKFSMDKVHNFVNVAASIEKGAGT